MKAPSFALIGEVTGYTAKGKVTIMNLLVEIDTRGGSEFKRYPITLFSEQAGSVAIKAPIGSKIQIACLLTSKEYNGSVFYNVTCGEVKVLSAPKPAEPFPANEPVEESDNEPPF